MKKILFDLLSSQPIGSSKYHGGGEYIKTIFGKMVEEYSDKIEIIPFYNNEKFIDDWIIALIRSKKLKCYTIKSQEEIKEVASQTDPDIFFSGLPAKYSRNWFPKSTKIIGTIHGLRKIEKPHDEYEYKYNDGITNLKTKFKLTKWKIVGNSEKYRNKFIVEQKKVIDFLDEIICVSEHTKYALKYYYSGIKNKTVKMFYSPKKSVDLNDTPLSEEVVSGEYILLLGGDRWLKNPYRALKAIDSLYDKDYLNGIKTVVVGKTSQCIRKEMKNNENYIWLEYVDSNVLEDLYKNCSVFVYPTLNEGFGYPPLEAMHYNRTCVVSAVCSLQEICGDAVYYVNPYDTEEIANRILRASDIKIDENKVREQYEKISRKQDMDLNELCEFILK